MIMSKINKIFQKERVIKSIQNIQVELKVTADDSDHLGLLVLKNWEGNIL